MRPGEKMLAKSAGKAPTTTSRRRTSTPIKTRSGAITSMRRRTTFVLESDGIDIGDDFADDFDGRNGGRLRRRVGERRIFPSTTSTTTATSTTWTTKTMRTKRRTRTTIFKPCGRAARPKTVSYVRHGAPRKRGAHLSAPRSRGALAVVPPRAQGAGRRFTAAPAAGGGAPARWPHSSSAYDHAVLPR